MRLGLLSKGKIRASQWSKAFGSRTNGYYTSTIGTKSLYMEEEEATVLCNYVKRQDSCDGIFGVQL